MRHPSLPAGQTITVAEIAVAHHRAAGWELAEAPAPALSVEQAPPFTEGGDTPDPVAPKRRRTQKEDI